MTAKQQAVRTLRRTRHAAVLRFPGVSEILTVNDMYTDRATDVPALMRSRDALFAGVQEGKNSDYRRRLPDNEYGVRQRMTDEATQGVAVIWRRSMARAVGGAKDDPISLGHGWEQLGAEIRGETLARGIVWQDLETVGTGERFRAASAHRYPQRVRSHWPAFDDELEAWLEKSPLPVVVCMDANERGGPNVDPDYQWRGVGIDGFLTNMRVPSVFDLPWRQSDHRTVSGGLRVRA